MVLLYREIPVVVKKTDKNDLCIQLYSCKIKM